MGTAARPAAILALALALAPSGAGAGEWPTLDDLFGSDRFHDTVAEDLLWLPDGSGFLFRDEREGRAGLFRHHVATGATELVADWEGLLADLRRQALAAGRDPLSLPVSIFAFEGTQSDNRKRYQDLGVARVVLVAPRRLAEALPFLDRMAGVIPDIT